MTEHQMLYMYVKENIIGTVIDVCTFNDMDVKATNNIGVYIKGSQVSNYRDLSSGKYLSRMADIVLNYNCYNTKEGIFDGISKLEAIRDKLETVNNKRVYFSNGQLSDKDNYDSFLSISQIDLMSDILYLGKNSFNIPGYSIRFKITYIKGGN